MVTNREHSLVLLQCIDCYNAIQQDSGIKFISSVTVRTSHVKLDKASVSEWSSVHYHPCAHLKGLVHTIHLLTCQDPSCREYSLNIYACDAGANNNSWAMGESLSKTACIFCQKSNGETLEKLDPVWHSR